jgi:hypothetical protein
MDAVGVLDGELAAFVVFRRAEEERCGEVGPNPVRRARNLADRVVDVAAEGLPSFVAIEEGGNTFKGSAADMKSGLLSRAFRIISPTDRATGWFSETCRLRFTLAD